MTAQVYWYYDETGGAGKSFMSDYLQTHHNAFIVSGAKVADIAHAFDEQPIVCFGYAHGILKRYVVCGTTWLGKNANLYGRETR